LYLIYITLILSLQAFCLVEWNSFHQLLKFCQPSISEKDILHHHTLCAEILRCADIAKEMVRNNLKNVSSKISFTFNAWTSAPGDPYLSLTAHYIDALADHPNAWELKFDQLIFQEIEGRHTGKKMGEILGHTLSRYDLHSKVCPIIKFPIWEFLSFCSF
jgi:hypothetical protein